MIHCDPICYFLAAILLLLLPLNWLLSAATAALVHESCHLIAVFLLGGKIRKVQIAFAGCEIECGELETAGKVVSILAGPAGSFCLLLFRRIFPQIAVCGLIQGCFNLLPVIPLDGGRVLQMLLYRFYPETADRLLSAIRYAVVLSFVILMLWLCKDFHL